MLPPSFDRHWLCDSTVCLCVAPSVERRRTPPYEHGMCFIAPWPGHLARLVWPGSRRQFHCSDVPCAEALFTSASAAQREKLFATRARFVDPRLLTSHGVAEDKLHIRQKMASKDCHCAVKNFLPSPMGSREGSIVSLSPKTRICYKRAGHLQLYFFGKLLIAGPVTEVNASMQLDATVASSRILNLARSRKSLISACCRYGGA